MAFAYKAGDRDQLFLLPPSMWDWLEEDHLAFFVIDAIEMMETSAFDQSHPCGPGAPAEDPKAMLGILMYAYAIGVRSSRVIARACREDLADKVIAVNLCPDHRTIARFRAENEAAIKAVLSEVLKLCKAAGLTSLGQIAIDGTKIGSDAALDQSRDASWIASEIDKVLREPGAIDAGEETTPQLFDAPLPEKLRSCSGRLQRLKAALSQVQAAEQAAAKEQEERDEMAARAAEEGRRLRGRKPKGPRAALGRAQADVAALRLRVSAEPTREDLRDALEEAERRVVTAEQAVAEAPCANRFTANVTDPESRMMKTQTGWVQGYNVQAAVNASQVVVAYATTNDHNDVAQLIAMGQATQRSASEAGIDEMIGRSLADAGCWSEENATAPGPDRLIATTKD